MKNIEMQIGDVQYDVLEQYAKANDLTPGQYATNIVVSWLNSHIHGFYIEKVREETFENLEKKFGKVDLKKKQAA